MISLRGKYWKSIYTRIDFIYFSFMKIHEIVKNLVKEVNNCCAKFWTNNITNFLRGTINNRIISFSRDSWTIVWYHAARKNPQSITTVLGYICMRFWYAKDLVLSTVLRVYTQIYSLKGKRSRIRHGNAQWTHTHTFTRCRARAITPRAHGVCIACAFALDERVCTRITRESSFSRHDLATSSRAMID